MGPADLHDLYRSESRDHLERLSRAVLGIERGEGRAALDEAFRSAHTLKGMSAAMGHEAVVSLAHGLEHLLERVRTGVLEVDVQVVDLMLSAVDELEKVLDSVLSDPTVAGPAPDPVAADAREPVGARAISAQAEVEHATPAGSSEVGRFVRVEQERLDRLMNRAGELIIARERLARVARVLGDPELSALANELAGSLGELREDALRLRLGPVGELAERLHRATREAARSLGKVVELQISGAEVEIDRGLLGELGELLTHLLRNAIDHGIETPEQRRTLRKPAAGVIRISVQESRDSVVVRVEDDGRGVDPARVLEQAIAKGLRQRGAPSAMSESELLDLLVLPGFSTAARVTPVSGRGVGLDHVATTLRELGGELRLATTAGAGAKFSISLPRTLSVTRVLLMGCGDELVAIPAGAVERVEDDANEWAVSPGDGSGAPVLDLSELCGYTGSPPSGTPGFVVVLGKQNRETRLRVDTLLNFQEVVVKRFAIPRGVKDVFAGATILSDGKPRLVLDPVRVIGYAHRSNPPQPAQASLA